MSKTISNFIKLAPPGTKAVNALVLFELKGREIAATPPLGTKPAPKDLSLIGLLDASQIDPTSPLADERSYEVLGGSMVTLEASKRDLADTKAVLVINGTVTKDPPNFRHLEDDEASQPLIKAFGDQPGLIVKHFLCAMWGDKNVGGGCYFFESLADIETYLSSEFWATNGCAPEMPWVDVTYEAYEIVA